MILEKYFEGEDFRIYVVDDKVVAAYTRKAAHVVGDGKSTVHSLIENLNKLRKTNPNTRNKLITIDQDLLNHLKLANVTLDDVPPDGMEIKLRSIPNISLGGNPADVTSKLALNIQNAVIKAVKSIKDLPNAGVDVLINKNGEFTVIEMNSVAVITAHVFPIHGAAIDVPARILDYYFPETTDKKRTSMTFNYTHVLNSLESGIYEHVEVKSAPQIYRNSIALSFTSDVKWINPKSVQAMLQMYDYHGYIINDGNKYMSVITIDGNIPLPELIERLKQRFLIRDVVKNMKGTPITHTGIYIKKDVPD